jgi:hypothetical protein
MDLVRHLVSSANGNAHEKQEARTRLTRAFDFFFLYQ